MRGLLLVWMLLGGLYAQLRQPSFLHTSTDNGLPTNEIYSLLQDRQGMLWMGSEAGLIKHCGAYFKVLRNKAQRSPEISGLAQGYSGRIYGFNFNRQIFFIEQDSLHLLRTFGCNISSIGCDSIGTLWVTTDSGMFRYEEPRAIWHPPALILLAKNGCADPQHHLWCYEGGHIAEYWETGKKTYLFNTQQVEYSVLGAYYLAPTGDNVWMIGLMNGQFFRLQAGAFRPHQSPFLARVLKGRKVTIVRDAGGGEVWILTHSGAIRWNPATDTGEEFFPQFAISDVLRDREGNHWFSTLGGGIVQVPDLQSTIIRDGAGSSGGRITQLRWHQGALYFGTQTGILGRISPDGSTKTWDTGLKTKFYCLKSDIYSGELVAATSNQVFRLRQDQLSAPVGPFPPIKDLQQTDIGWLSASSFGLYLWKTAFLPEKHIKYAWPWATQLLWQPRAKRLWAATHDGLYIASARRDTLLLDTVLFGGQRVMFVAGNEAQTKAWAVTTDNTLWFINAYYKINNFYTFPLDIQIHQLLYQDNSLYFATNRGVHRYDIGTQHWQIFATPDGLWPEDVLAIAPGSDQLYVSAGDRLHAFPLRRDAAARPLPLVHLAGIFVDGKRVKKTDFQEVKYQQLLAIEVQASAYASLSDFQYAWRLAGDSVWRMYPAATRQIVLSGLPAGAFTLEIKAIDHTGRDSANRIWLRGRVLPPFWQRWWFYSLLVAAITAVVWTVFRQREKALLKKQKAEIQRLELEHALRMSQQTALAARMNPHFMFNVLNAIKSYIYENDKKQAIKYLTDFSILMREVLQMSDLPTVTLSQELHALRLYIQLESMLCEGGVQCEIVLDPALDPEHFMLPAMLLQPIVENAFRHGLRHKIGDKILTIRANLDGKISIEDNGIGRAAAAALNQHRHENHTSFGSSATQKRIELLNFEHPDTVGMAIEDLFAADGSPAGTRVTLSLSSHA